MEREEDILMSNEQLQHLSQELSEIKALLEKQNGRVRTNEKAIAVNEVLHKTLKEQLVEVHRKLDLHTIDERTVWEKFEKSLDSLSIKVDGITIQRAEEAWVITFLKHNLLALLILLSMVSIALFGTPVKLTF